MASAEVWASHQVGRVFDPFVDKIIICGAFIFLAAEPNSGVAAWMAVVVVGREMLVSLLPASSNKVVAIFAQMAGKLKMVFQCVAVVASLLVLTYERSRCLDGSMSP